MKKYLWAAFGLVVLGSLAREFPTLVRELKIIRM
jgi:hypothetical protein